MSKNKKASKQEKRTAKAVVTEVKPKASAPREVRAKSETPARVAFMLRLEQDLHRSVTKAAAANEISANKYVSKVLRRELKRQAEARA